MQEIDLDRIIPNPEQPRINFDQAELDVLAESIREHGVIQPITVEQADDGLYILHDGERRFRAARLAGLLKIPALVVPALNGSGRRDRLIRAMVANLQRADLTPVEEARAYQRMRNELGMSVTKISRMMGISQPRISSRLKILRLDESIQGEIDRGRLPKDEATLDALLSIEDSQLRKDLALRAAERRMTAKGIVEACRRLNQHLSERTLPKSDIPAIWQAERRSGPVDRSHWDALAQVGRLPPWILLEIAARETCKKCSWYDVASDTICRDCPLPQLLSISIGKAKNDR
ncbi:MAG: ParB/RepB/Spo0J family partition protein [Anaerolineales bacterium]|nr:ParB/RepB/Spo0J family partition protein [Anaerolineales bacterium]